MTLGHAFEIENLKCTYNTRDIVLFIEKLDIPSSGMIFVVGPSGSGKSTLLETLGLMNNTIQNPDTARALFHSSGQEEKYDLTQAWENTEDYRSALRSRSFSFLFQQTNLMPHFTAGENMCTSMLIQGHSMSASRERVMEVMTMLDLDHALFDRRTSELSGGQRQRLAFVRAFTGTHHILFGDEPTGNLDAGTARKLMDILKNQVETSGMVCIVVSHDLDLAHQYADMIIPIRFISSTDNEKHRYGFVTQTDVYLKQQHEWRNHSGNPVQNIRHRLSELITSRTAESHPQV